MGFHYFLIMFLNHHQLKLGSSITQKDKNKSRRELLETIRDMKNTGNEQKSIIKVNANLSAGEWDTIYQLDGSICPLYEEQNETVNQLQEFTLT